MLRRFQHLVEVAALEQRLVRTRRRLGRGSFRLARGFLRLVRFIFVDVRHDHLAGTVRTTYHRPGLAPGDAQELITVGTTKSDRHGCTRLTCVGLTGAVVRNPPLGESRRYYCAASARRVQLL